MISYIVPFILLYLLSESENFNFFSRILNSKYFYFLLSLFFILFIGLRSGISCDWDTYISLIEKYSSQNFGTILKNNFSEIHKLDELGNILMIKISNNIYLLNILYSILFVIPLFIFCSTLERKYLALLISYPYYIVVVGMGPIRQAACISLLMFSIILIMRKRYYSHFLVSIFSLLIHQSSILVNGLILIPNFQDSLKLIKNKVSNIYSILLIVVIITTIAFNFPSIIYSTFYYFKFYGNIVPQAKSAIFIWLINFIPSIIFISNYSKFDFKNSLNRILILFAIFGFLLLPLIFVNSVIAYRLLLYLFPSSIIITSNMPNIELFQIKKTHFLKIIYASSFSSLIIWLNFAYHSSCWVPYRNILFK